MGSMVAVLFFFNELHAGKAVGDEHVVGNEHIVGGAGDEQIVG